MQQVVPHSDQNSSRIEECLYLPVYLRVRQLIESVMLLMSAISIMTGNQPIGCPFSCPYKPPRDVFPFYSVCALRFHLPHLHSMKFHLLFSDG